MQVPLTRGLVAIVDDDDGELVAAYTWCAATGRTTSYAETKVSHPWGGKTTLRMHRLILGLEFGDRRHGDHINGNGLDNRRSNLRISTPHQNSVNRRGWSGTSSRYKGVSLLPSGKWRAYISAGGKQLFLGNYATELEAAAAYDEAALDIHGNFARLNLKEA